MNYADARNHIKSGDILAFRGRGPIAWIIRRVTGGSHTHVGVAWWLHNRLFVLEAVEGAGVQLRAASALGKFDWLPTGLSWTNDVEVFALSMLGKPYSYLEAIGAGLGFEVSQDGFICSEYVAEIFRLAGVLDEQLANAPTPTDLVQYSLDQGASLNTIHEAK